MLFEGHATLVDAQPTMSIYAYNLGLVSPWS